MLTQEQIEALKAPFPAKEIHWRAGATNKENTKALAMAYIDARAVMDRLDEVVGPMNWQDTFDIWKDGAVKAGIGIRNESEWIWKYDGADETTFEATKGGISDAFKRAAVKWGIGRYLYQLDGEWVACRKVGNTVRLSVTPQLPAWALPEGRARLSPTEPQQESPAEELTPEEKRILQRDAFIQAAQDELGYADVTEVLQALKAAGYNTYARESEPDMWLELRKAKA